MMREHAHRRTDRARLVFVCAVALGLVAGLMAPAAGEEADPPPTMTVTPSTGLVDGQVVTVAGTGWSPHDGVGVSLCGDDESACPVPTQWVDADGAGAFSTEVRARAAYASGQGATDCRDEPCAVQARQSPVEAALPVSFDSDAPLVPPPVLTVDKSDDLIYGDEIVVSGTGFFPDEEVIVAQCFAGVSGLPMPYCGTEVITADSSGSITELHRITDRLYRARSEHDCRGTPSSCPVTAASANPPYRVRATVDVGLRLEGRETAMAAPTRDLRTGQTVEVRASGLNANHVAYVGQCYVDEQGTDGACVDRIRPVLVGRDGSLTETVVVRRTWHDEYHDRTVDCTVDRCHLLVAGEAVTLGVGPVDDRGPSAVVRIGLSFAGAAATPASPTAVTPAFAG